MKKRVLSLSSRRSCPPLPHTVQAVLTLVHCFFALTLFGTGAGEGPSRFTAVDRSVSLN